MTPLHLIAHWATHMHHYRQAENETFRREKERQMKRITWKVVKTLLYG